MTSKASKMGAAHTAGIFADMTVDGPIIGTLVAVVDRAKNLPNRKTMGKQNPYCAARLGKEAKKTETDKRGGQTPRWDQELRFTVHDSPDYYNLKVSVFNDDKKTDLIGETWVSLESVVIPGGGQSDIWHGLNFKGKYAGEIRIELTYYDSRPKEETAAPAEKRRESIREGAENTPERGLKGPRQSTPVRRRPLPTDPTRASNTPPMSADHIRSSAPSTGLRDYQTPPRQNTLPLQADQHEVNARGPPHLDPYARSQGSTVNPEPQQPYVERHHNYGMDSPFPPVPPAQSSYAKPQAEHDAAYGRPVYSVQPIQPLPQEPKDHRMSLPSQVRRSTAAAQPYAPTTRSHHEIPLPHSHSAPAVPHVAENEGLYDSHDHYHDQHQEHHGHHQPHGHYPEHTSYTEEPQHFDPYQSYPGSHRLPIQLQPTVEDEDDGPPPPPPAHRSLPPIPQQVQETYHHEMTPAPLDLTSRYRQPSPNPHSPLSYDHNVASTSYGSRPSSSAGPGYVRHEQRSSFGLPDYSSRPISRDAMAPSPLRTSGFDVPPSLIPGYDRNTGQTPPHSSRRQSNISNGYTNELSSYSPNPDTAYSYTPNQAPPSYETPSRPQYTQHQDPAPLYETPPPRPQSSSQDPPFDYRNSPLHERGPSPAPMIKPRAVSPDMRSSGLQNRSAPTRKSVSPAPQAETRERRLSGIPFSPDSFDELNPQIRSREIDSTVNAPSAKYNTPAGAEEAARLHDLSRAREEEGPIVGPDGRVIDPSEHLPITSWAPEPERKGPEKARSDRSARPSPRGAQPMPLASSGRTPLRDTVIRTSKGVVPVYASNSAASSPGVGSTPPGRNRLHKKAYGTPTNSANVTPLREHENYGGYNSSPGGGSPYGSRGGGPPPIPAKVPIQAGMEIHDREALALSRELESIDIGISPARGTVARGRWSGYGR